jgi:hypothetical protein
VADDQGEEQTGDELARWSAEHLDGLEAGSRALLWFFGAGLGSHFGDVGAAVGSGVASLGADAVTRLIRARVERFGREVAEEVALADLEAAMEASPSVVDLVREAIDTVSRTDWEAKRRLLAKVIANAVRDDAAIDELTELASAARAIEPPHILVLVQLEEIPEPDHPSDERKNSEPSASREVLREGSQSKELFDRHLGVLVREGLAREVSTLYNGGATWGISPFGRRFLHWLRDVDP